MKPILRKNQQGIAMIIAIMVLSLGGSIALISFRSSTQELGVSRFTEHEMKSRYLVESGVDQVVSWIVDPATFPNTYAVDVGFEAVRTFFENLPTSPCLNESDNPDLIISDVPFLTDPDGPFHELKTMGAITELKLYAHIQPDIPDPDDNRLCTVEVTAISGDGAKKKIKVDLANNPIGPITAGIQGVVASGNVLPIWTHWGEIRYAAIEGGGITPEANLGSEVLRVPNPVPNTPVNFNGLSYVDTPNDGYQSNEDPVLVIRVEENILPTPDFGPVINVIQGDAGVSLDPANPDNPEQRGLRRFLRANGELYTVSSEDGKLEQNGFVVGTFDEVFGIPIGDENPNARLVWISHTPSSSTLPLPIEGGRYKGYFFFSGEFGISISGNQLGRDVVATTSAGDVVDLVGINLEGLFYTSGPMKIQDGFKAYGAFFSRGGFTGNGTQDLEVWYNNSFNTAVFPGVRPVTPLAGTWATLASDPS